MLRHSRENRYSTGNAIRRLYYHARGILTGSEFLRHVLMLMTGSGLSVLVTILASPLLTRLYSPKEFGLFAVYLSLISILGTITALRYDMAIVLPSKDRDAVHLLALGFIITCVICSILFFIIIFFSKNIAVLMRAPELEPYLITLAPVIFLVGCNNILTSYCNRDKSYRHLSFSKVSDAATNNGATLAAGMAGLGLSGLIFGNAAGRLAAFLVLIKSSRNRVKSHLTDLSREEMKRLAHHYNEFPGYSTLGSIIGTLSSNLHLILFLAFYDNTVVGVIALATRILLAPLQIFSASFSQVFYEKSARLDSRGQIRWIYIKSLQKLSYISLALIFFVWLLPQSSMGFIFGKKWADALFYMRILVFWFAMQFVAGSLSVIYTRLRKESWIMWIQVINLIITMVTIYIPHHWAMDISSALIFFTAGKFFLYFCVTFLAFRVIKSYG